MDNLPIKNKNKTLLWVLFIILIISVILLSVYFADKNDKAKIDLDTLHYDKAEKIDVEFDKIESDVVYLPYAEKRLKRSIFNAELKKMNMIKYGIGSDNSGVFKEKSGVHYLVDVNFDFDYFNQKISHDYLEFLKVKNNEYHFIKLPLDSRWKESDSFFSQLSCFSCGCSCYYEQILWVSDNKYFIHIYGEDYAMIPENQGIYIYRELSNSWEKIVPKTDQKDMKIQDNGCSIFYTINENVYKLNVCK